MDILNRFINYTKFYTESDGSVATCPSTSRQYVFAQHLVEELKQIGMEDITLNDKSYIMATLPANTDKDVPTIGFVAHLDTSPDLSGKDVSARVIRYEGGDIILNKDIPVVMSPTVFPDLNDYVGEELVVTDGTTLLGADDKAGIASIMNAMQYLVEHPELKHGKIRVGFTPDEEIGRGADFFDVEAFGAEWAYTIDGGEKGELEYENFNAAAATIRFKGRNVHPGSAKDKMINAGLLAVEFASWLPADERPEKTTGYEGFYHLIASSGSVEEASLTYIVRDHSREKFEQKKALLQDLADRMNQAYPESTSVELSDQYYNMKEIVAQHLHIVDLAHEAMLSVGVTPKVKAIRGGTDGARLSFMGLPCPNIFAGGLNFHGRYEYLPVKSLEKSSEVVVRIATLLCEKA